MHARLLTLAVFALSLFAHAQDAEEPLDLVKRYDGTLGKNLGITLLLAERDDDTGIRYDASYYYHKSGLPITLTQDENADQISFREVEGYSDEGEEKITGRWVITWEEDRISGTWSSPDGKKSLPITLKESYPAGSVRIAQTKLDFALTEKIGYKRNGIERSLCFLRSPDKGMKALNARLAQITRDAVDENKKVPATLEGIEKHLRAQVRDGFDAQGQYISSQSEDLSVRMNAHGFLTIEQMSYAYEGGAHGNHGSVFHVLDIKTGKALKLSDLVQPGYQVKWTPLAAAEIRRTRGAKPDAPLTEAGLFEDKLELNENWFLVPGGIGFNYAPYEIAAYAMGSIEFVLPWKDIIGELKPGTPVHDLALQMTAKAN